MNKTISINLGGFFFHIDENAYQKLTRYFDAVKRSLEPEGRDEIIKDIESRIAELFQEKLKNEKQVISLVEIDEVIDIMGQPEDYIINEEPNYSQKNYSSSYTYPKTKKLYRDRDNSILGGVAAGFGHYVNIDPLWIRLIMILIVIAGFGSPIVIYLILWIIVPEAITTSQKLEMRGEPINISNIEKKVKEGISDISDKFNTINTEKISNSARNGANQIATTVGDIFLSIFKVIGKIIGVFITMFSAMALLGIVIFGIIMIFTSSLPETVIFNYGEAPFMFDVPLWIQGFLLILAIGIPFLFLLILGLKLLLSNMRPIGNYFKYTLLAIWILAIASLAYLGIKQATEKGYEGKIVKKEQVILAPTDTLNVKMKFNDYFAKSVSETKSGKYTHDENNNEIIYSNNVRLHILYTEEPNAYLQIEKTANGKSHLDAKEYAEKINYNFEIQGNNLILDNYFTTDFKNKFRDQEVHIYLYLPETTILQPDYSIQNYDWSDNDFFNLHYSSDEYIYQVKNKKAMCLNCPAEENEYEDIFENDTINENLSIKINNKELNIHVENDRLNIQTH